MVLLVSYSDESEIVAIADGCCTHLFVLLIVANSDDSELLLLMIVARIYLCCL